MIKVIVIASLLLIAAYCSYQVAAIINWQKLLRSKQEQFGVAYDNKRDATVVFMKQLRMVCVTCAALTIFVPTQLFPSNKANDNNAYLVAETNKTADTDDVRGLSQEVVNDDKHSTVTTVASSQPVSPAPTVTNAVETTKSVSLGIQSINTNLLSDWNTIKKNKEGIEEIVIESYESAIESLSEARLKSLLTKELFVADLIWDQEDYVVKVKLPENQWIRLHLKNINGNFYVHDEANGTVYQLK